MKTIIVLFMLTSFLFSSEKILSIGILSSDFKNKKFLDLGVKVLEKDFAKILKKDLIKIKLYANKKILLKDFSNNKLKILISHPFLYFNNKKIINKHQKFIWLANSNQAKIQEYYLIANYKAKNVLQNLSHFKLLTLDIDKNPYIWFEYLFYKKYKKGPNPINHTLLTKESKIIYNVFFNKNTLAVVNKETYKLMTELNPQIKQKTKIIKSSKAVFIQLVGFSHISMTEEESILLNKAVLGLKNTMGASILSDMSTVNIVIENKEKKLANFFDFYSEYIQLKNKYK